VQRRTFLKVAAISLLSYYGVGKKAFARLLAQVSGSPPTSSPSTGAYQSGAVTEQPAERDSSNDINTLIHHVDVLRPEDLLNLRFEFVNLSVKRGNGEARLGRLDLSQPAYIRVIFPPQHIAEEAINLFDPIPSRPLQAYSAGPSRLVFRIPNQLSSIPFDIQHLLSWVNWLPSLSSIFTTDSTSSLVEPHALATAIEAPYRLIVSPDQDGHWEHAVTPVSREYRGTGFTRTTIQPEQRIELWHTRLHRLGIPSPTDTAQIPLNTPYQPASTETEGTSPPLIRAIWTPDFKPVDQAGDLKCGESTRFFSLTPDERAQIVHLTSNSTLGYAVPIKTIFIQQKYKKLRGPQYNPLVSLSELL